MHKYIRTQFNATQDEDLYLNHTTTNNQQRRKQEKVRGAGSIARRNLKNRCSEIASKSINI